MISRCNSAKLCLKESIKKLYFRNKQLSICYFKIAKSKRGNTCATYCILLDFTFTDSMFLQHLKTDVFQKSNKTYLSRIQTFQDSVFLNVLPSFVCLRFICCPLRRRSQALFSSFSIKLFLSGSLASFANFPGLFSYLTPFIQTN